MHGSCIHYLLTLLEVVCLPDVDEDERHELQLREALPRGRGQREEVPQVRDLRVDHVPPHLGRTLGRLPVRPDAALNDGGATIIYFLDLDFGLGLWTFWTFWSKVAIFCTHEPKLNSILRFMQSSLFKSLFCPFSHIS